MGWSVLGVALRIALRLGINQLGGEQERQTTGKHSRWGNIVIRELARHIWWNLVSVILSVRPFRTSLVTCFSLLQVWLDWSWSTSHDGICMYVPIWIWHAHQKLNQKARLYTSTAESNRNTVEYRRWVHCRWTLNLDDTAVNRAYCVYRFLRLLAITNAFLHSKAHYLIVGVNWPIWYESTLIM
jgi:hypothetical protein